MLPEDVKRVSINTNYLNNSIQPTLQSDVETTVTPPFQKVVDSVYENLQNYLSTCSIYLPQYTGSVFTAALENHSEPIAELPEVVVTPTPKKNNTAGKINSDNTFNKLMEYVFQDEGGYANHAKDPGGATNMGICKKWYDKIMGPTTLEEFKSLTKDDAKAYYYKEYWIPSGAKKLADEGNEKLAYAVFDAAIHHGIGRAKKLLASSNGDADKMLDNRLAFMKGLKVWKHWSTGLQARIDKVDSRLSCMA